MARRNNDAQVIALFVAMKDIFVVLLQYANYHSVYFLVMMYVNRLKDVKDDAMSGTDGVTFEARMQSLIKQTAVDIKSCGNTCDAYSKLSPLVKVLNWTVWETAFANLVRQFSQRQSEFELTLSIHIAGKVVILQADVNGLVRSSSGGKVGFCLDGS